MGMVPIPPIVVDENGLIEVYPSVEDACAALEAIDVLAGEYEAFDSAGHRLIIDTAGYEVTAMRIAPTVTADPDELARRLRRFVLAVGRRRTVGRKRVGLDNPEGASLQELLGVGQGYGRGSR